MSEQDLVKRLRTNPMGLETVAADRIEGLEKQNAELMLALQEARDSLQFIHDTFKRDMDQGYSTKDKQFAVSIASVTLKAVDQASQSESSNRSKRIAIESPMILAIDCRQDGTIAAVSQETESGKTVRIFAIGDSVQQAKAPVNVPNGWQGIIEGQHHRLEGIDTNQPGFHWRSGWNYALRRLTDVFNALAPAPPMPECRPPKDDRVTELEKQNADLRLALRNNMPEHLREFVEAIAEGFESQHPQTQETYCAMCAANLDAGEAHETGCMTLRAQAILEDDAASKKTEPCPHCHGKPQLNSPCNCLPF